MNNSIRPSSINGIKRLAKDIKISRSIPHHKALDEAARAASFQNYRHALKQLQCVGRLHTLYLTVYWSDRDQRKIGRETISVEIDSPFSNICSRSEVRDVRGLHSVRLVAEDHLVFDLLASSQKSARGMLLKSVRTIIFMQATGLRPLRKPHTTYPQKTQENRPPSQDHPTHWFDPSSGQAVLVYEPYEGSVFPEEDESWRNLHNWHLRRSTWTGMYFPGRCPLFVATDASKNFDIDSLMDRIDALSSGNKNNDWTDWTGISVPDHETFFSPLTKSSQDRRRAKAKGTIYRMPSSKTIPYGLEERRPNSVMPLQYHKELGVLFKAVLASRHPYIPFAASRRLDIVRSALEDWMCAEHRFSRAANDINPIDVYYSNIHEALPRESCLHLPSNNIEALVLAIEMVQLSYNDCAPRREITHKIEGAIRAIKRRS
ncbi:DUF5623 domain-containing protein [Thalassospira lucentensis]|uniref:DUF5623 domain-containing protein n=1 Tax=Thalassospira lucentensis TaxID=168935 RepID=UPI00142E683C|nr:DUF5623 domain-containing protein [Thalassospira lucentensis]NIZ01968.1 DUF5623 domain-containing protein [Thalassospira lucentensis]